MSIVLKRALYAALGLALAGCGQSVVSDDTAGERVEAYNDKASVKAYSLDVVATGFDMPWGIAFLPNGGMLVSEREGNVSYVAPGETTGSNLSGTPQDAVIGGQGGYLGIALDPDFDTNRYVYLAYSKGSADENSTAVMRARLSPDHLSFDETEDIFVAPSKRSTRHHYGGRLLFLPDNTLLISLGDGFRYMDDAQSPQNSHGTIYRINSDGSIPADNPFADGEDGLPGVYSYGHRNVQGLAYDESTDTLYAHEHGPKGGDEINVIEPGKNYGWPAITYGVNYNGTIITTETEVPGMEQPRLHWTPSIAPAGLVLYTGDVYPELKGALLTSALAGQKVQAVHLKNGQLDNEYSLFEDAELRFRHIAQGPDGYLYLLVDDLDAPILRIGPAA